MTIATATPHETYQGLRRQFLALQSLATSLEEQASRYRKLWADQAQQRADLDAERTTNSQLTASMLAAEAERDQLKAENEALRKDAERYRFVRNPIGTSSPLAIWNEGKMPLFSGMADAVVDEYMAKELTNKGHGHVFPRHEGVKAKCGGPGLCAECAADQQAKEASHG